MIQRYDPMFLTNAIGNDPVAIMWPDDDGGYVAEVAHRAAVRELVEALRKSVLALAHADEQSPGLYRDAYETVSAAIAKHQEGKE